MLRRLRQVAAAAMLGVAAVATAAGAAAEEPAGVASPAADPRVADAVRLWEAWVEYQAAINGVPGISVGIVHDQELIAANAFGHADAGTRLPATVDTLYSICSISKLFTGIAVMQLQEAGKLRLDDPVAAHLDWFRLADAEAAGEPVTIRGLLTHSAGLPRETDHAYWTGTAPGTGFPFPAREDVIARLPGQAPLYPPGRVFQYSNLGFVLAGEIVAAVSGMSFDEYLQTRILGPLGMGDTFTDVPALPQAARLARGYSERQRDGPRRTLQPFQTRAIRPAAGMVSSVTDLARFARWQNRLLGGTQDAALRAQTLREMQRVQWVDPDWNTTWGLAFEINRDGDRTLVGHSGGCPGYYSHLRLEPKTKLAVIALANAINAEVGLYTGRAFDLVGPALAAAATPSAAVQERSADLQLYAGIYGSDWGEIAVTPWEEGLALLVLASRDPKRALVKLKPAGEHAFSVIRQDGTDLPGDIVRFEMGADGRASRYRQHGSWYVRVR
jgi:CubicO group peptidase (beta-lactamase class C family)